VFFVKPTKEPVKDKFHDFQQLSLRHNVLEPEIMMRMRRDKMTHTLQHVNNIINERLNNMDKETIDQIADFVHMDHKDVLVELAAGLIYTSTTTTPDDYISPIAARLKRGRDTRIAVLHAKDSNNLRNTMTSIMEQWMSDSGFVQQGDDDLDEIGEAIVGQRTGIARFDPDRLLSWWMWMQRNKQTNPILTLIIPSPLALPPMTATYSSSITVSSQTVLPDLILLLHRLAIEGLPFRILFLGLPPHTALESNTSAGGSWSGGLTDLLPASCLRVLNCEKFWVARGQDSVAQFIESLWLHPHWSWQPDSNTFLKMWDRFELGGGGVSGFVRAMEYAIMVHFYSNPLSILTPAPGEALAQAKYVPIALAGQTQPVMDAYMDLIKASSPSLQRHFEQLARAASDMPAQDATRTLIAKMCTSLTEAPAKTFLMTWPDKMLASAWQYFARRRLVHALLTTVVLPDLLARPTHTSRPVLTTKLFENIASFDPEKSHDQGAWVSTLLNDVSKNWSRQEKSFKDSPWYALFEHCKREWKKTQLEFKHQFPKGEAGLLEWDMFEISRLETLCHGNKLELDETQKHYFIEHGVTYEQVCGEERAQLLLQRAAQMQQKDDRMLQRKTVRSQKALEDELKTAAERGSWEHWTLEAGTWLQSLIRYALTSSC